MNEDGSVTPDETGQDDTATTEAKKTPAPIPYARFNEVVNQRRALEAKLANAETALTAAETAKLDAIRKAEEIETSSKTAVQDAEAKLAVHESQLTKYQELLTSIADETVKEWPDEVKVFDPGPEADPAVRLEWAQKAKLLVAKLNAPGTSGAGMSPKPSPKQPSGEQKPIKPSVDVKSRF